jgi:cephalosporin-C deacetylase-like acetyl esterase
MKKIILLAGLSCLLIQIQAVSVKSKRQVLAQNKEGYRLEAGTDRPGSVYRKGEKVTFWVKLLKNEKTVAGEKLLYHFIGDGKLFGKGTIITKAGKNKIVVTPKVNGFLFFRADYIPASGRTNKIYVRAGAGVEPLTIKPSIAAPNDFDSFWDKRKAQVKAMPLEVKKTRTSVDKSEYRNKVECFDIQINCPGGKGVSAYLTQPVHAADKSLPLLICFHAAGVRSSIKQYAYAAKGFLVIDMNAHGMKNGLPQREYIKLYKGKMRNYRFWGTGDPQKIYFNGMFLRLLRILQYAKTLKEWDGKTIVTLGGSQGGAQAIVAAGLDSDVTACIAHEPAMCDHAGFLAQRRPGWPKFISVRNNKPTKQEVFNTVRYFDVVNFAARIKNAKCLISTGFIDTTCWPSGVYAAFNQIKSKDKEMINYPWAIHGGFPEMDHATNKFLDKIKNK